jgi:hypothetical protein
MSPDRVTLQRTGGIAGFNDTLVVDSDGKATLSSRGKKPFTCTVTPRVMSQLAVAADAASKSRKPKSQDTKKFPTATPDAIHLYLTIDDERIRYQDLEDGDDSYRDVFQLMNDVLASASALRKGQNVVTDGGAACTE